MDRDVADSAALTARWETLFRWNRNPVLSTPLHLTNRDSPQPATLLPLLRCHLARSLVRAGTFGPFQLVGLRLQSFSLGRICSKSSAASNFVGIFVPQRSGRNCRTRGTFVPVSPIT